MNEFNLSKEIIESLKMLGYSKPTKVQELTIPKLLNDEDIIVKAKTGSGKTAAFAIPICENIKWDERKAQALVITPTRELALQIREEFFNIGRLKRLKVSTLFGKDSFTIQAKEIKERVHVVVGTPGRLLDHLERGTLNVDKIKYLIIDEADEMFAMGFIDQLKGILEYLPTNKVTALFSATINNEVKKLSDYYLLDPKYIEIQDEVKPKIKQALCLIKNEHRKLTLRDLMIVNKPNSAMIFCNTQKEVEEVYEYLSRQDFSVDRLHGGLRQEVRIKILNSFKRKNFRYLVCTDVAARGIDVADIDLVFNYELPDKYSTYVHRIGRTGRINKEGQAISLYLDNQKSFINEINAKMEENVNEIIRPTLEEVNEMRKEFETLMLTFEDDYQEKGHKLNENITRLHINAGKKTKMRAFDIIGCLCSLDGVEAKDIGVINVKDVSTYIEILNNKGKLVYKLLQNTPIKGRLRKVSYANEEWFRK